MRTRIVAAVALFAVPAAALAQGYGPAYRVPVERSVPAYPYDVETTGSIIGAGTPRYDRCPGDSAAEGNANQQNFPTKQYGQTAGGPRC